MDRDTISERPGSMRPPLVVAWRIALGLMSGTVVGALAGMMIHGADLGQGELLVRTAALGGLGGAAWVWLWERWHAREAKRVADRIEKARRKDTPDAGDANHAS